MSDNCYIGGDGVSEEQLDNLTVSATNSVIATSWSQFYAIVGSATNVIENVKLMDSSLIDDGEEDLEVSILKAVDENGEEILVTIDDDDELEAVYSALMDLMYEDEEEEPSET